jgi:hypothetical protein
MMSLRGMSMEENGLENELEEHGPDAICADENDLDERNSKVA